MSFLNNFYYKVRNFSISSLAENQQNISFWEGYLNNLKTLDFSVYQDKLKVPVLVPIGKRIYFRGEIKHTNEVTAALGAGYFAKCSLKQAEVLKQHRIKDAQTKLNAFLKEKEYLENQWSFKNQNILEDNGQEIIEVCTDEEDNVWREKHRENVRQYKQSHKNYEENVKTDITDEELWNRLEELELQEELENELGHEEEDDSNSNDSFIVKDEEGIIKPQMHKKEEKNCNVEEFKNTKHGISTNTSKTNNDNEEGAEAITLTLLEKVLNKQSELEDKLFELKTKERPKIKTEEDLISKLDEMEQLEELEDDMERIENILESEDVEIVDENKSSKSKSDRRVSFANEEDDEPETLELTFKHSNVEPCNEPYDSKIGITKPSDIYEKFSHLFVNGKTSILKKTKYKDTDIILPPNATVQKAKEKEVPETRETIVVNDIVDRSVVKVSAVQKKNSKPQSLFKRQRQQMKSN